MVDHPWYSSTRWFAGGLTLNYGHDPLVYGTRSSPDAAFQQTTSVIEHQLIGHVDLAGSFLDRILLTATLPVTLLERGTAVDDVGPISGVVVGDPRFGVMARLYGHADKNPISVHLGLFVWAPIKWKPTTGDQGVRVMPKLVLGGYAKHLLWSFTGAFYYRPESSLGSTVLSRGSSVGSEVQLGLALGYADWTRRFHVGPEMMLSTVVLGGDAFAKSYTSLEVLLGGAYNIVRQVQVGLAAGVGLLREPGTPDARVLLRLAYAPIKKPAEPVKVGDSDGDGILDDRDRCPYEPEDKDGFEDTDGCPDPDNDKDGVLDRADRCPNVPGVPENFGCPDPDTDGDGIVDRLDRCPRDPEDKDGFEDQDGCPDPDNDQDGVLDAADKCPLVKGPVANEGCPDTDRDGDTVVDRLDNCPDEPGDPANHGCKKKQLVEIRGDKLEILDAVFFETNKDVIQKRSYALLQNVAQVLKSHAEIKRVVVEGHTDSQGAPAKNLDLSDRRARSVVRFLVGAGVDEARLSPKGFGQTQPVADNKTASGRARNRRVVFRIAGANPGIQQNEP